LQLLPPADALGYEMTMINQTLEELRPQLLAAMLPNVAFDGWTAATVRAGATAAGIDPDIARLIFSGDASAMVAAYTIYADERMTAAVKAAGIEALKVRAKITLCVRTRLEYAAGEREAVRRALAVLALPTNLAMSATTLWKTADAMWAAAGDTATDYNYYSKRLILAGVYSATLLYWLNDESEGYTDSWAFLDRRIAGIMAFEGVKARVLRATAKLPDPVRFLGRLRYPAV